MNRPNYGAIPYDWLCELPDNELETLAGALRNLIAQRPSAFSVFKAHAMRSAVECVLFDRQQARRSAA
jgi:hypothetical protein